MRHLCPKRGGASRHGGAGPPAQPTGRPLRPAGRQPPAGPPGPGPGRAVPDPPFSLTTENSWRKPQPSHGRGSPWLGPADRRRAAALGPGKDMPGSWTCREGGRKGPGFPVGETAQSWNRSSPSFRRHAPRQWAPLSLPFIRTEQGNILKVAAKIKYFKCLASDRSSVNSPLFTYGFCHKDS